MDRCWAIAAVWDYHAFPAWGQYTVYISIKVSHQSDCFSNFILIFATKLPKILPAGEAPPPFSKEILAGAVVGTTLFARFVFF